MNEFISLPQDILNIIFDFLPNATDQRALVLTCSLFKNNKVNPILQRKYMKLKYATTKPISINDQTNLSEVWEDIFDNPFTEHHTCFDAVNFYNVKLKRSLRSIENRKIEKDTYDGVVLLLGPLELLIHFYRDRIFSPLLQYIVKISRKNCKYIFQD